MHSRERAANRKRYASMAVRMPETNRINQSPLVIRFLQLRFDLHPPSHDRADADGLADANSLFLRALPIGMSLASVDSSGSSWSALTLGSIS
jgi:hypothetical protein